MTDEITERIRLVMQEYNLSPSAFADEIGVQRPAISHIMSGRNRPSLDVVMKILKAFDQINPQWLLTGEGKMKQLDLFGEISNSVETEKQESPKNQIVTSDKPRESPTENSPAPSIATAQSQPVHFNNEEKLKPVGQFSGSEFSTSEMITEKSSFENRFNNPRNEYNAPTEQQNRIISHTPPLPPVQPAMHYAATNTGSPQVPNQSYSHAQYPPPATNPAAGIPAEIFGTPGGGGKKVEKIVILYADKSFSVYHPE